MEDLIRKISIKNQKEGFLLRSPAEINEIEKFEKKIGFKHPKDFLNFYQICNGFECTDDIFNFLSLSDIIEDNTNFKNNWFYFSEYMIYSDMWGLRKTKSGEFEIFNGSYPSFTLSHSLVEFLERFLKGNVFENEGLYDWFEEIKKSS